MLYPDQYAWLVLVGMLDVMLTNFVLNQLGGSEANPVAQWFIDRFDVAGLIILKVATLVVVVLICEFVGTRNCSKGKRLAEWSIAISAFPVVFALALAVTA